MSTRTVRKIFTVINDKGLHTRPSTELVKCASCFRSQIRLHYHSLEVDAKSLLDILILGAAKGSKIEIIATGDDAAEAVDAILQLANRKFHINY